MRRLKLFATIALVLTVAWTCSTVTAQIPALGFMVETVAGNGQPGTFPGGAATALDTPVESPFGVELGPDGALYITSIGQHRVLRLHRETAQLSSVAGNGAKGYAGDGKAAADATLNEPYEVRFDRQGNMYFVEMQNHLIRRVDAKSGAISTIAGNGQPGYGGDDGPASAAQFRQPHSIAFDDQGLLYVADIGNHRIRRIDPTTSTITSLAGNGKRELPQDNAPAKGQPILGPRALFVTGRTLWIALREGNSVWRLDLDSLIIRHVAGTGKTGYTGDGGAARAATFNGPKGIVADSEGLVYVVDSENQAIRRIDSKSGQIDTIAGGGPAARGFAGQTGPALQAKFDRPHGICLASGGGLYIGDTNNHRVRWLHP